jgi:hypothetical protein
MEDADAVGRLSVWSPAPLRVWGPCRTVVLVSSLIGLIGCGPPPYTDQYVGSAVFTLGAARGAPESHDTHDTIETQAVLSVCSLDDSLLRIGDACLLRVQQVDSVPDRFVLRPTGQTCVLITSSGPTTVQLTSGIVTAAYHQTVELTLGGEVTSAKARRHADFRLGAQIVKGPLDGCSLQHPSQGAP